MRTGIDVAEARSLVLEAALPLAAETVGLMEGQGRVLAEPVCSERTLPPADCSAMDGYAVRRADLVGASAAAPRELPVAFEVAAGGHAEGSLREGEAARIFTGAPIPDGADSVVRQEDTEASERGVRVHVEPAPREHIRDAGEDVRAGEEVLAAGEILRAPHLGMLASLGRTLVQVHRQPRVAILSGGDELVEADGNPAGGRIVASNAHSLAAQCVEAGAVPSNLGIARDTPGDLERMFAAGLDADVLVSSAGVSVGDHDHVRPVLEKLGCRLVFWGVNMKPGYPIAFGRFEEGRGPLVFGLPGNPVSAMVTFDQFVRPVLLKMAGRRRVFRPTVCAILGETLEKRAGRLHFVRVHLERDGDEVLASTTGNQSSGVLRSMTLAQGLLVFPSQATTIAAGAEVDVQLLDPDWLSRENTP
jgi:molybdopterin molybdotransferase